MVRSGGKREKRKEGWFKPGLGGKQIGRSVRRHSCVKREGVCRIEIDKKSNVAQNNLGKQGREVRGWYSTSEREAQPDTRIE